MMTENASATLKNKEYPKNQFIPEYKYKTLWLYKKFTGLTHK